MMMWLFFSARFPDSPSTAAVLISAKAPKLRSSPERLTSNKQRGTFPATTLLSSYPPLSRHRIFGRKGLINQVFPQLSPFTPFPPPPHAPLILDSNHVSIRDCITAYNDLKLSKKYKFIIFKLSDDFKQIVIEDASTDGDWENFREKLINSTTKSKSGAVGKGCRYAVYDFEYNLASGDGVRNKITFIAWSPDDASVQPKMIYASSKEALKRTLTGVAHELQANDADDIEYDSIIKTVSKGLAG
ncbi:hypothetical protein E4U31_005479 [Claviceps sp. LM219 group G6]|nr:hypothetical protein E4U31_005479 [Claviceps sp. LM219 group G6]